MAYKAGGVIGHLVWFRTHSSLGTVTTDTDVHHDSFTCVSRLVSWFFTEVCVRSCSDVTSLIFPSTKHQQGFAVVS